ncbi:septation protein SepH [Frigoribacterium salinisoli]
MRELRVVRPVDGALVVATDDGEEYRLPVDQALRSKLRQTGGEVAVTEHKAPPRQIQALVRAGRTTEEVAALTGASVDQVRRFEGPVLAERSFVLQTARGVPVTVADAVLSDSTGGTFGAVIDARLAAAEASDRTWSSYKDAEHGWLVRVAYVTREVEREAVWRFDPKTSSLAPQAGDAQVLSQHSADVGPLVPRLRAVGDDDRAARGDDSGRFDSGAFELEPEPFDPFVDAAPERQRSDVRSPASLAAVNRDPDAPGPVHDQTEDLLEALRRRRGEREAARTAPDADLRPRHPAPGTVRVVDVPLDAWRTPEASDDEHEVAQPPERQASRTRPPMASRTPPPRQDRRQEARPAEERPAPATKRRGRTAMPSWDDIVFGARPEDPS